MEIVKNYPEKENYSTGSMPCKTYKWLYIKAETITCNWHGWIENFNTILMMYAVAEFLFFSVSMLFLYLYAWLCLHVLYNQ